LSLQNKHGAPKLPARPPKPGGGEHMHGYKPAVPPAGKQRMPKEEVEAYRGAKGGIPVETREAFER